MDSQFVHIPHEHVSHIISLFNYYPSSKYIKHLVFQICYPIRRNIENHHNNKSFSVREYYRTEEQIEKIIFSQDIKIIDYISPSVKRIRVGKDTVLPTDLSSEIIVDRYLELFFNS